MAFGVFWLTWILWETVRLGFAGLAWATVSQTTPPPNEAGGIANALWGSLLMVLLATFVGTPIAIMAGIYLAEYDPKGWLGATTRFVNDILLSAPSIVIGLFVYAVVVARYKQFSGYAGILALALIVIPVVIRTTENMLLLVPAALPSILSGLKIGWAFAWRTLIAAELVFGATSGKGGLGWYIFQNRNELYTDKVFAGLAAVILIGLLVENLLFANIERLTVKRWGMQR